MRIHDLPSPNHDERPQPVDMLVLHYTGMRSGAEAIARLRDPASRVSSHYVVEEDGAVFRLVAEDRRAWHAGVSHWRGASLLNGRSIGIEIVNPGHEFGYRPFPALQMAAVCDLCLGIIARHGIAARDVVAHSDIAPDRKEDPGELFDWQGLADNGVGLWPHGAAEPDAAALTLLGRIGYRKDLPLPVLLRAFQRHWRPESVDGQADAGTLARLAAVAAAVG
ncbi:N-acetylmuramoyl-L-alanine amidase [Falsiroseomonas sp. E2-1-a20]|uniref:N-acetylmuramoyl-L-alanine amidase n=1 Tax=Falsiroseomonas sp. E2-1-a20 TaxID=3239300 RepID=UPI003F3D8F36